MARLHTSFVLGYHGCSEDVGEKLIANQLSMDASDKEYDWLGPGVYFWEADPNRAWEWSDWKVQRQDYDDPFVIGAIIDLGNCLDLMARESLELLEVTYQSLVETVDRAGQGRTLPSNGQAGPADEDNLLRYRDCAVVKHLHQALQDQGEEPFDTVRGLFTEGGPLFEGSGFMKKTHVQIAVRDPACIKGIFRVPRP
ncbi:MAG: hypothetical protein ABJO72_02725 [Hyphomicrobiales bacterium]